MRRPSNHGYETEEEIQPLFFDVYMFTHVTGTENSLPVTVLVNVVTGTELARIEIPHFEKVTITPGACQRYILPDMPKEFTKSVFSRDSGKTISMLFDQVINLLYSDFL